MDEKTMVEIRDESWATEYENSLTLSQWQDWLMLKKIEREFAKNAGYDFGNGRYWEFLTIQELREAQS